MNCNDYQQDILLLVHGEIGFAQRIRVVAHLSVCPACREERAKLDMVSRVIGSAIRLPDMPTWMPARQPRSRRIASTRGIIILLIVAGVMSVLTGTTIATIHNRAGNHNGTVAHTNTGCVPNLPNDRCR